MYYRGMIEGIPEKKAPVEALDWRALLPKPLAAAFDSVQYDDAGRPDEEKYKDVAATLDRLAREAAQRGVDVRKIAQSRLDEINRQLEAGDITEGQKEFMSDESDAILQLILWGYHVGLIDDATRAKLRDAVN